MNSRERISAAGLAAMLAPATSALADVIEFTDRDEWFSAARQVSTIGFTEFPAGTHLADQYDELGVLFTDGLDVVLCCDSHVFPSDAAGLNSVGSTTLAFTTPQYSIAVDFPGFVQFQLFSGGSLMYMSSWFGVLPIGNFGGLISTEPFDTVLITDPVGNDAFIDDLHFGVPAPGALWLLAAMALCPAGRKRRRRCTGAGAGAGGEPNLSAARRAVHRPKAHAIRWAWPSSRCSPLAAPAPSAPSERVGALRGSGFLEGTYLAQGAWHAR